MAEITSQINCSHCGAPLPVQPGEILVTCNYCGFTSVIETGKAFEFEHSLIMNTVQPDQVFARIRDWMGNSFMAPKDFSKKSSLQEQNLIYLPFWVVSGEASTEYKGMFERISPAVEKRRGDHEPLRLARPSPQAERLPHQILPHLALGQDTV